MCVCVCVFLFLCGGTTVKFSLGHPLLQQRPYTQPLLNKKGHYIDRCVCVHTLLRGQLGIARAVKIHTDPLAL